MVTHYTLAPDRSFKKLSEANVMQSQAFDNKHVERFCAFAVFSSVPLRTLEVSVIRRPRAWNAFASGKLYYCADGGTMDFIFVGDRVHHPESVAQVVPRSMSNPDEIKAGWSIKGLWCL